MDMLAIIPAEEVYEYRGMRDHVKHVTRELLRFQDPRPIRMILALASLLWSMAAWRHPEAFDLPAYSFLRSFNREYLTSNMCAWAFFLHAVLVVWQTYDPTYRQKWALGINAYGLGIWTFVTVCVNISIGFLSSGTGAEWALVAAAGYALYTNDIIRRLPNVSTVTLIPAVVLND